MLATSLQRVLRWAVLFLRDWGVDLGGVDEPHLGH